MVVFKETWYQDFSAIGRSAAAIGVLIGGGVLLLRRTAVPRVRATTSAVDYLALILLGMIVLLGIYLTLGIQTPRITSTATRSGSGSVACSPCTRTCTRSRPPR